MYACDSVHVSTYPVRTIVAQQFDRRGGWKKKLAALAILHASYFFPQRWGCWKSYNGWNVGDSSSLINLATAAQVHLVMNCNACAWLTMLPCAAHAQQAGQVIVVSVLI